MTAMTLPPVIDTATVASLRNQLLEVRGEDLELDASQVQRAGGLALQVLIAAATAWGHDGRRLTIVNRSTPFAEMMRMSGADLLPEFAQ